MVTLKLYKLNRKIIKTKAKNTTLAPDPCSLNQNCYYGSGYLLVYLRGIVSSTAILGSIMESSATSRGGRPPAPCCPALRMRSATSSSFVVCFGKRMNCSRPSSRTPLCSSLPRASALPPGHQLSRSTSLLFRLQCFLSVSP